MPKARVGSIARAEIQVAPGIRYRPLVARAASRYPGNFAHHGSFANRRLPAARSWNTIVGLMLTLTLQSIGAGALSELSEAC
jgi:hypothetical protein